MGPLQSELTRRFGAELVLAPGAPYLSDATESRGIEGRADAVVLPRDTEEVSAVLAFCHERGVAVTPRGGGTGFAAGAVPLDGGIVLGLERMTRVRAMDPGEWRMHVEAGLRTADVRRLARENGLYFPPDPGAAEQSLIGGNIATNAGGPHAYRYGVTGAWVSGLEAVLVSGERFEVGGAIRKDVAGYDLRSLLVGSEGTLAVITAAWLKLIPAPESAFPVLALYEDAVAGCAAIDRVRGGGLGVATIEYLDATTIELAPPPLEGARGFAVIVEADGSREAAGALRDEAIEALSEDARAVHAPVERREIEALWRWRDGVSIAVSGRRGGKVSEDIVVPVDRIGEVIAETVVIGARHGLEACSWGHAGDGNLHSTFLVSRTDAQDLERAERAAEDLFALAISMGGSVSGEHGLGWAKRGALAHQWGAPALALHAAIKHVFDPSGLLNPGKKLAEALAAQPNLEEIDVRRK